MSRIVVALLLAATVLVGCAEDEIVPVETMVSPAPVQAVDVGPDDADDPYAIPDEITPEYVEQVYEALAKLEAEAIAAYRDHVENGGDPTLPPKEAIDRFRAIYSDDMFPAMMTTWHELAAEGFPGLRRPLGQAYLRVREVVAASTSCILVVGTHDLSQTAEDPGEDLPSYVALVPSLDEGPINPTPWEVHFEYLTSGTPPSEDAPCRR